MMTRKLSLVLLFAFLVTGCEMARIYSPNVRTNNYIMSVTVVQKADYRLGGCVLELSTADGGSFVVKTDIEVCEGANVWNARR